MEEGVAVSAARMAFAPRNLDDPWQAVADALPRFTPQECQNHFNAA